MMKRPIYLALIAVGAAAALAACQKKTAASNESGPVADSAATAPAANASTNEPAPATDTNAAPAATNSDASAPAPKS
jgi:hypothetical protein